MGFFFFFPHWIGCISVQRKLFLSLIGIVGEIAEEGSGFYIWTHKKFDLGYNGKQIVDVNLTSDAKVKLEPGAKFSFSYEVSLVAE